MGIFTNKGSSSGSRLSHGLSVIFLVYGVLLIIGSTMGNTNLFQPLQMANFNSQINTTANQDFKPIINIQDLNQALTKAKSENKLVLLDFSAKWCTSCKLMEHRTFSHPDVIKALGNFVTLKADVTENDQAAKKMEKQFSVIAPPTLLFFDNSGKELAQFRIVGEMGPNKFLEHLQTVLKTVK